LKINSKRENVKSLATILILMALVGCDNVYRYPCQNPDNFGKPECQKPRCLFTQDCPEYLVAPVLEKKIAEQPQPAASNSSGN
jgi:hypothetical protein